MSPDAEYNDESARQVYTLRGAIFQERATSTSYGTVKLRTRFGELEVHEYQYTHVEPTGPFLNGLNPVGEYVAAGIRLGNYVNTPPQSGVTLHVHYVVKVFSISRDSHNIYTLGDSDDVTYLSVVSGNVGANPLSVVPFVPWVNNLQLEKDGPYFNPRFSSKRNTINTVIELDVRARTRTYALNRTTTNTYTAQGLPPGLTIGASTGFITGMIDPSAAGQTYSVEVVATDDRDTPRIGRIYFTWHIEDEG
jgi:hypothetical protein